MATTRFTQLEVWKKAHQAVLEVYRLTAAFPADERFMMVSQMRRAAVSVPANIAEGYGRRAPRDKARCYTISQGSVEELGYLLILARDLGYARDVDILSTALDAVGAMPRRLIDRTGRGMGAVDLRDSRFEIRDSSRRAGRSCSASRPWP